LVFSLIVLLHKHLNYIMQCKKLLFYNSIMCELQDIKPQNSAYVITANFVMSYEEQK